jgi:hypothetical protein
VPKSPKSSQEALDENNSDYPQMDVDESPATTTDPTTALHLRCNELEQVIIEKDQTITNLRAELATTSSCARADCCKENSDLRSQVADLQDKI